MQKLFDQLLELQQAKRMPPVTQWRPTSSGEIDIRICADGTWLHEGEPIRRAALVALFATILRLDADGYALVTPAERLAIVVEDKPFLAVDMEIREHADAALVPTALQMNDLLFTTNVGDYVLADADHPLTTSEPTLNGGPAVPCLEVRNGLQARLARPLYYRLVDYAIAAGGLEDDRLFVASGGQRFDLGGTR